MTLLERGSRSTERHSTARHGHRGRPTRTEGCGTTRRIGKDVSPLPRALPREEPGPAAARPPAPRLRSPAEVPPEARPDATERMKSLLTGSLTKVGGWEEKTGAANGQEGRGPLGRARGSCGGEGSWRRAFPAVPGDRRGGSSCRRPWKWTRHDPAAVAHGPPGSSPRRSTRAPAGGQGECEGTRAWE